MATRAIGLTSTVMEALQNIDQGRLTWWCCVQSNICVLCGISKLHRSISFLQGMSENYKHYPLPVAGTCLRSFFSSSLPRFSNRRPMFWMAQCHTKNSYTTSMQARLLFRLAESTQPKTTKCSWTILMAMTWGYKCKLTFECACRVNVDVQRNDLRSNGFIHFKNGWVIMGLGSDGVEIQVAIEGSKLG